MDGRESSLSLQGEGYSRNQISSRRNYKYKLIGETSAVDETLFGSHRDREIKDKNRVNSPLKPSEIGDRTSSPKVRESLSGVNHSRRELRDSKRGNPSYVDESLFGKKLELPNFEPPWAEKKDPKFKGPVLSWSPPVAGSLCDTPRSRPSSAQCQRSSSRLSQRSGSSMGSVSSRGKLPPQKPPWR
ncbi:putative RBPJ-interacting and tubulin-associated protein 1-like [Apostichopus japonicus]|uniref:RBPJ-interacting and tubulin-associated protein 1 n=1 Tax=Stichopus japonicus TaxID=307972 RepID=A0A2G8JYN6_STIJA|nr:putative RBPJ-interacting and tubulin-associated protein 1-like [Apostichopus japonicus]